MHTNLRAPLPHDPILWPDDDRGQVRPYHQHFVARGEKYTARGRRLFRLQMGTEWPDLFGRGRIARNIMCAFRSSRQVRSTPISGCRQYQGSHPDGPARRRCPGGGHAGDPAAHLFRERSSAAADHETLRYVHWGGHEPAGNDSRTKGAASAVPHCGCNHEGFSRVGVRAFSARLKLCPSSEVCFSLVPAESRGPAVRLSQRSRVLSSSYPYQRNFRWATCPERYLYRFGG